MCSNPQKLPSGNTVKCRNCGDCLNARQADWVARAMAEKAMTAHTYSLTLTYRPNEDGTDPDGAHAFRYRDVQNWLRVVRREAQEANPTEATRIRYICAGEMGSQRKRVHWHVIVFASVDLAGLGTFTDMTGKPEPFTEGRRQIWSLWPHGFIHSEHPDAGGMAYVLKYILKDQFSLFKSRGTAREATSDTFGASFFRMSKKPPIGTDYVVEKIRKWRDGGYLPPEATLQVPGYKGFWWPVGDLRKLMLRAMWAVNAEYRHVNGCDVAQWAALLASVERLKQGLEGPDYEMLQFGEGCNDDQTEQQWEREFREKQAQSAHVHRARERRSKCGGVRVCDACFAGQSDATRDALETWRGSLRDRYQKEPDGFRTLDAWYRAKHPHGNPFCGTHGLDGWEKAFPA